MPSPFKYLDLKFSSLRLPNPLLPHVADVFRFCQGIGSQRHGRLHEASDDPELENP